MKSRERLLLKFNEEYDRLNEQQRQAVDQVEGPVMVIAGPGTGKTQILSARIGKILLSDAHVEPQNILCLTYTDAGVVAMRRRLSSFIGPDAYRVGLYTFHAFCNDVIQDNLNLFEKNALDPISDLERIELMKELIDSFSKDNPLKRYRGDVYFEMKSLQSLFSMMKKEGWSAGYICGKIDEFLQDLQNRDEYICKRATKEYKKGDIRWDKIKEQEEKMEKLRAACNEFSNYQALMRRRNLYDFDDMINWVIDAFQNNENLLRNYQEQFQYILVDEYQDTSGSQNRIVELLINYWDKPNVFVVGDDDQSIYRFQGANVENMMLFADTYTDDLLKVVLQNNYRSTQPILDISKTLIDRNEERLVKKIEGLTKDLIASKETAPAADGICLYVYETQRDEMINTTCAIEELVKNGVGANSIGIIYRENKYGEELANFLRLKNIPFYSKRSLNILDQNIIQQVLLLMNYLRCEHDIPYSGDEMLFEILHFQWLEIPAIEIAKAAMKVSEIKYKGTNTSLREWLCEEAKREQTELFGSPLHPKLKEANRVLEYLLGIVPNETLLTLLEKIVRDGGFLSFMMKQEDIAWQMQLLSGFYDHVKDECRRHPVINLEEFMTRIELMRKEGLILPLVQVSGNEKGVNLMTVHGSKGLEFDYVFFVGCTTSFWEKKRKPGGGFSFPDTLFSSQSNANDTEELRRLFYVALTRAKGHLYLSYPNYTNEGKQLEPSMFLAEIEEEHPFKRIAVYTSEDQKLQFSLLPFQERLAPEVEHLDEELINRVLGSFTMNVSALNSYLRCPLGFYYQTLIRIPSPKNESTEFGSAVHYALEQLFRKMRASGEFADVDDMLNDFTWYMKRHRESFTREQFQRRMEYGTEVLKNYYNTYYTRWNKVVTIEMNIKNLLMNGVPLRGKLDKIEFNGKEATIIDYKTGDPDNAKEKLKRPNDKNPDGGDYWRQAIFYKILIDLYPKEWMVNTIEFDFIEPDKRKQYRKEKIVVSDIDVALVKEQVTTVWKKIQEKDFYTGCGKDDCHWCNFAKTNKLAISLHELKEEEDVEVRGVDGLGV